MIPITPFSAIVLAADRHPAEPVAQAAGVCCKALSPVGNIPMVLRVLAALDDSKAVDTRILCGPAWSAVEQNAELQTGIAAGRFGWVANRATPSTSAYAVLQSVPETTPVLLTTADHALLTPLMVDYFCEQACASGCDVLVALAAHAQVTAAYPQVRRTVLKFQDDGYCGCNLFAFLTPKGRRAADFWRQVESQRKKPLRAIATLGWMAVLRYLLGCLSLSDALEQLSQRMDLKLGAVIMPFAAAAIDVDSVEDWKLVQTLVSGK